jgi:hypothetical protein
MPYPIGRGVRVEVENVVGTAKTVTAITAASPPVASSATHGLANGAVGYFSGVSAFMPILEGMALRIANTATGTFELQKIRAAGLTAFSGSASFFPISTWHTVGNATAYQIGGGDAPDADQTVLLDTVQQLVPGMLNAQTVTIPCNSDMESAAMLKISQAAEDQAALTFRITLAGSTGQQQRVFRGIPTLSNEDMGLGQTANGTFSVRVFGRVLFLPPVV